MTNPRRLVSTLPGACASAARLRNACGDGTQGGRIPETQAGRPPFSDLWIARSWDENGRLWRPSRRRRRVVVVGKGCRSRTARVRVAPQALESGMCGCARDGGDVAFAAALLRAVGGKRRCPGGPSSGGLRHETPGTTRIYTLQKARGQVARALAGVLLSRSPSRNGRRAR